MRSFLDSLGKPKKNESTPGATPEELIGRYSGMSEDALMRELAGLTQKRRADGTYDPDAIKRGVEAISPMLSESQRAKLKAIIEAL